MKLGAGARHSSTRSRSTPSWPAAKARDRRRPRRSLVLLANATPSPSNEAEIKLAEIEVERSGKLVQEGAGSQRDLDVRTTNLSTTRRPPSAEAQRDGSEHSTAGKSRSRGANAEAVESAVADATLKSPVTGRVLYRLAEAGEVLSPGGKALTLVNLEDVYMEIFLPAERTPRASRSGAEGPDHRGLRARPPHLPAYATFVSPEAQFTPRSKSRRASEREKKSCSASRSRCPRSSTMQYLEAHQDPAVRGVPRYVKVEDSAVWPARLAKPPEGGPPHRHSVRRVTCEVEATAADCRPRPVRRPRVTWKRAARRLISIGDVTHRYGEGGRPRYGISLEIPTGIMVGIVGPDGVGEVDVAGPDRPRLEEAPARDADRPRREHRRRASTAAPSEPARSRTCRKGSVRTIYLELSVRDNVDFANAFFGLTASEARRTRDPAASRRDRDSAPLRRSPREQALWRRVEAEGRTLRRARPRSGSPHPRRTDDRRRSALAPAVPWSLIDVIRAGRPGMSVLDFDGLHGRSAALEWIVDDGRGPRPGDRHARGADGPAGHDEPLKPASSRAFRRRKPQRPSRSSRHPAARRRLLGGSRLRPRSLTMSLRRPSRPSTTSRSRSRARRDLPASSARMVAARRRR